jgi:Na+-transporting NADH:ubiquinone oxidoreductase subunit C
MSGKFKKLTPTICILALLFIMKFAFMKPGDDVEKPIPTNEIQYAFKSANVNVFKSTNVVKSNKKEQILAALNINDIEDADAEYSKYIVAEHIIKKDSIDKVSGFNVVDANISNENLPLYVANINKTTKYVIPIVRNQVYYGYISLDEDGKTIYGVYLPNITGTQTH